MNNAVLEYIEGYFGGELNETISGDRITDAFYELIETANAVADFLAITNEEDGYVPPSVRDRKRTQERNQAELEKKQNAGPKPEPKRDTTGDENAAEKTAKQSRAHTGISPGGGSQTDPYSRHDYRGPGDDDEGGTVPITYSMRGGQRAAAGTTRSANSPRPSADSTPQQKAKARTFIPQRHSTDTL